MCVGQGVKAEMLQVPAPVARAVAEAAPYQSLQGGQRRAAQLLSTRTPAAPGHVRLARCQPPAPPRPAQSQQLPAPTSSRPPPPVQPGHCRNENKSRTWSYNLK